MECMTPSFPRQQGREQACLLGWVNHTWSNNGHAHGHTYNATSLELLTVPIAILAGLMPPGSPGGGAAGGGGMMMDHQVARAALPPPSITGMRHE
jgi:hypothetical protein